MLSQPPRFGGDAYAGAVGIWRPSDRFSSTSVSQLVAVFIENRTSEGSLPPKRRPTELRKAADFLRSNRSRGVPRVYEVSVSYFVHRIAATHAASTSFGGRPLEGFRIEMPPSPGSFLFRKGRGKGPQTK